MPTASCFERVIFSTLFSGLFINANNKKISAMVNNIKYGNMKGTNCQKGLWVGNCRGYSSLFDRKGRLSPLLLKEIVALSVLKAKVIET